MNNRQTSSLPRRAGQLADIAAGIPVNYLEPVLRRIINVIMSGKEAESAATTLLVTVLEGRCAWHRSSRLITETIQRVKVIAVAIKISIMLQAAWNITPHRRDEAALADTDGREEKDVGVRNIRAK